MKVIDSCIMRTRTGGGRVVVGRWRHAVARVIASPVPVDEENPKIWCGTQGSENRYTAKKKAWYGRRGITSPWCRGRETYCPDSREVVGLYKENPEGRD